MATEQPTADSASIEDRLTAVFSATPEAAPAAEDESASLATESATPDGEAAEVDTSAVETGDGFVDFTLEDGTEYRVPAALREVAERGKGFTEKMQRLAQQQEQTNDRADYLQAREAVMAEVMADVGQLRALQTEHAKYASLDWQALYNADPGQALKLRDQRDQLEKQMAMTQGTIQQKAQRIEKDAANHAGYQWDYAVKGAAERIGKVSQAEDAAMLKTVQQLGFTEKELKSRFADPRFLHAIYKAAKWDSLQSGKSSSVAAVQKAPPVIKPGASKGSGVEAANRYRESRATLRKTGSINDAARLIQMMSK
jgi:hypothetical protein